MSCANHVDERTRRKEITVSEIIISDHVAVLDECRGEKSKRPPLLRKMESLSYNRSVLCEAIETYVKG